MGSITATADLTCGRGFFTASCHFVVVTDNDNTNDDDEVGVK